VNDESENERRLVQLFRQIAKEVCYEILEEHFGRLIENEDLKTRNVNLKKEINNGPG